jgi:uncharacterized protein (TIGR02147 family)
MERPVITTYENYRDFLRDWYAWMKETHSGFSFRSFSRWAGFKSPNQLQLIIQGKRNITSETLPTFVRVLKLKRRERSYFELLVNMNQATTPEGKASFLAEISEHFRREQDNLRHSQYEYLLKWYYPVIRELITTKGFRADRHAITRRIGHGITPRIVDAALARLEQLGLIQKEGEDRYRQKDAIVSTGPETQAAASYFYHRQMITLALDALMLQMPEERNFSAITLACRRSDIPEIAQILTDCRQQILAYLENRGAITDDEVYQLNLQLFRITDGERKEVV